MILTAVQQDGNNDDDDDKDYDDDDDEDDDDVCDRVCLPLQAGTTIMSGRSK